MIELRIAGAAVGVLAALAAAACAAPGSGTSSPAPGASSPTVVPSGCDLSATPVKWGKPTRQPHLTRVTLFRGALQDGAGDAVLDEPFTPSIARVAAPPGWGAELARSLGAETGSRIQTGPGRMPEGSVGVATGGQTDPSIPETLLYEGVATVSAVFTADCTPAVSGVFTSWTTAAVGAVTCGRLEDSADPLARLARRFCPRTPSPQSSFDAVPFDTPPAR